MSREIISKKQRNLLLLSQSIQAKDFSILRNFLVENERLRERDMQREGLKNIRVYYDDLLKACQNEWKPSKTQPFIDLGTHYHKKQVKCELCDQSPLRYQHKINNQFNKRTLVIGSECAKEFGEGLDQLLKDTKDEGFRASRRMMLDEEFPGIRMFSESLYKYTKTVEIILSRELEDRWLAFCTEFTKEYEKCLEIPNRSLKMIRQLWEIKANYEDEIQEVIRQNKLKEFVATKEIRTWLEKTNNAGVIKLIQDDGGMLSQLTLYRIYEENLVKKVLKKLAPYFHKEKMKLINYSPSKNQVYVKFNFPAIRLSGSVQYSRLIEEYCELAFGQKANLPKHRDMLEMVRFDQQSEREVIHLVLEKQRKQNKIIIEKLDNKIFIRANDVYKQINYNSFFSKAKYLILQHPINEQELESLIKNTTEKILSHAEYKLYQEIAKEAAKFS